ncbi:MAG TPA: hypothetical protein VMU01_09410 [Rhizomicrobium sp.]|nr:hypothetical protein [Rhizomicrobium sp.]
MRFSEYLKQSARIEKSIAECWDREIKAESGKGPWFVRLFPGLRATTITVASRKRQALARQRHLLQRTYFADPSYLWNADALNAFRRTVPSSADAVKLLRDAAEAALNCEE